MNKLIYAIIFLLPFVACNQASTDPDQERLERACDQIVQSLLNGDVQKAMQLLKQNSKMESFQVDSLQRSLTGQMIADSSSFGKVISYDFVIEKKLKDYLAVRSY